MKDEWNKDPAKWIARPLHERLEMLREYYCTGPCGQSATVQGTSSALDIALREVWAMAVFLQQRSAMRESENSDDGREQFEAWISSEPYAESIQRVTSDWYRSPKVNLAWAAWRESRRVSGQQSDERK